MNNVIEINFGKESMLEKKYARFDDLKGRKFSDILTPAQEKEYNDLDEWFEIHIRSKKNKQSRIAN